MIGRSHHRRRAVPPARVPAALAAMMLGAAPAGLALADLVGADEPLTRHAAARLIDPNTASAAELRLLPSVGPALARNIIEHRETVGPFRDLTDLDAVPRIGERTLKGIAPFVRVEGVVR
jgi:competence ComEA-like helix-hairpin-helix protein